MPPREQKRLEGRNGALWREYCRGATQEELAEKYGIAQSTVSNAIATVRESIPIQDRMELIAQEVDFLRKTRQELMDLWDAPPAPVTAGKDGDIVRDPETGAVVYDHNGRLQALRVGLEYTKHLSKILGLEASTKVEINTGEEAAARAQAVEAATFVHGGEVEA